MKSIEEMNKGELQEYARQELKINIDMRKSVDTLREELSKVNPDLKNIAPKSKFTHLKNPVTGFFWPYTDLLKKRGDLIPCDEHGNVV